MKHGWKSNTRYEHLFVIVRVDAHATDPENSIVLTKAMRDRGKAEEEAERLNRQNASKGSKYFVRVARLDES